MRLMPAAMRAAWCAACIFAAGALPAQGAPSTFGSIIGSAILCRSHLDNAYFNDYLTTAFGVPYKHEGGAWWFKADATLWGMSVTDVIVSDDTSALTFLGAVADATPDSVAESVRTAVGVHHQKMDNSKFPVLESSPGSRIVYFNTRAKIYCAKFKQLPPQLAGG
jgi:hypothetical protein